MIKIHTDKLSIDKKSIFIISKYQKYSSKSYSYEKAKLDMRFLFKEDTGEYIPSKLIDEIITNYHQNQNKSIELQPEEIELLMFNKLFRSYRKYIYYYDLHGCSRLGNEFVTLIEKYKKKSLEIYHKMLPIIQEKGYDDFFKEPNLGEIECMDEIATYSEELKIRF